ncbi:MAG TPA: hypothetical protein VKT28_05315, partial [Puia sp.]|nr:hypothetical protein [Puia sp.]
SKNIAVDYQTFSVIHFVLLLGQSTKPILAVFVHCFGNTCFQKITISLCKYSSFHSVYSVIYVFSYNLV